jgi:hypothetical protein
MTAGDFELLDEAEATELLCSRFRRDRRSAADSARSLIGTSRGRDRAIDRWAEALRRDPRACSAWRAPPPNVIANPPDLGVREALGDRECAGTCAGAEIERAPGRLDCLERGDERCEAVLGSDRLPTGSQEIELELYRPPQQAPERRPADDERRRNSSRRTPPACRSRTEHSTSSSC